MVYERVCVCVCQFADNKTVIESHMDLQVGHSRPLKCYYAHEDSDEPLILQRRCYWLLKCPDIVMVHYLRTKSIRIRNKVPVVRRTSSLMTNRGLANTRSRYGGIERQYSAPESRTSCAPSHSRRGDTLRDKVEKYEHLYARKNNKSSNNVDHKDNKALQQQQQQQQSGTQTVGGHNDHHGYEKEALRRGWSALDGGSQMDRYSSRSDTTVVPEMDFIGYPSAAAQRKQQQEQQYQGVISAHPIHFGSGIGAEAPGNEVNTYLAQAASMGLLQSYQQYTTSLFQSAFHAAASRIFNHHSGIEDNSVPKSNVAASPFAKLSAEQEPTPPPQTMDNNDLVEVECDHSSQGLGGCGSLDESDVAAARVLRQMSSDLTDKTSVRLA